MITADNISSGFAGAAFVIYLSGLTSIKFTATQYALLTSFMMLPGKVFSGFSGYLADSLIVLTSLQVGWALFFVITSALTLPALITIND